MNGRLHLRDLIEDIYKELTLDHWYLTEREFSKEYLGRCGSYFAYLKSSDSQPSADVVLHLWGKLSHQKAVAEYQLPRARHPLNIYNLENDQRRYSALSQRAFEVLSKMAMRYATI
jgi:hypothetical protein